MVILRNILQSLCALLILSAEEIRGTNNLAYEQPSTQGGTFNNQSAGLAVDSDSTNTCAFSDNGASGPPAWWQVDLQYECYITSVTIQFPSSTNCQYMQGFVIIVSDNNSTSNSTLCYTFSNGSDTGSGDIVTLRGLRPTFTCIQPLTGRYVTIRRQGGYQTRSMSFCDVQVNGFVIVDRAHGQPAYQSQNTYQDQYGIHVASWAVDGDETTCSITDTGNDNVYAWWYVDLQDLYSVTSISILAANGSGDARYLQNFSIYVSNLSNTTTFLTSELCFTYISLIVPINIQLNLTCTQELLGRYVIIKRNGPPRYGALTLCEVNILTLYSPPPPPTTVPPPTTTPMTTAPVPTSYASNTSNTSLPYSVSSGLIEGPTLIGIIVGCVLGGMLLIILLIFITLFLRKRKHGKKKKVPTATLR